MQAGIWSVIAVVFFVCADTSYALLGFQLGYSRRWHKEGEQKTTANVATASGHASPLPLIPVALGLSYSQVFYDLPDNQKEASGMELGVELLGWVPMVPVITPHARLHYTVLGHKKLSLKKETKEREYGITGLVIGLGASYGILPFISLFLEISQGFRQMERKDQGEEKLDFTSQAVIIGAEASI